MSVSPPATVQTAPPGEETALPYGRPVRRRIAVPLALALGVGAAIALVGLHDRVVYYRVTSDSMRPTLQVGSRVAVEPGVQPKVGEIVVFHPPAGAIPEIPVCGAADEGAGFTQPCGVATAGSSRAIFIKRVVAGPGDLVSIRAGRSVVNGVASNEPFAASCTVAACTFQTPVRVPAGHYYVLGDNRGASDDSRFWGPIQASSIVGVAVTCEPLQTACRPRH